MWQASVFIRIVQMSSLSFLSGSAFSISWETAQSPEAGFRRARWQRRRRSMESRCSHVDSPSSLCWFPGGWRLFHSFFQTFSHCATAEGEDQFPAAENGRESLGIHLLFKDFEVSYCLKLLTFTFGATQRLQLLSISSVVLWDACILLASLHSLPILVSWLSAFLLC